MSWVITGTEKNPVDLSRSNVSLLLHGDGTNGSTTITDSSPTPKTVTAVGNAQISTAQSKFGGASLLFDGNGDSLNIDSNAAFAFGANNFTVELWAYQSATPNGSSLIAEEYTGGANSVTFAIGYCDGAVGSSGGSRPFFGIYTGSAWVGAASANALANNQWHHIAGVRLNDDWTLYVNGASVGTFTSANVLPQGERLFIGRRWDLFNGLQSYFNGHIDDLRITKGVARYTANFTPPTAAFPDI
jgi:hypothetical protein